MGKTYLQCKSVLPLHIANRLPSSGEKQINETTTKKPILPNATESINFGRNALNSIEPKNAENSMSITIEYEMNEEEEKGDEDLDDYYVNDNDNNNENDKNDKNNENDEDDDEDDDDMEDDYSSDENGKRASNNKKLKNQPSLDDCGDCDDDDEDANKNEDEDEDDNE